MTETIMTTITPAGQFKLGCSGKLAPNVAAKVSLADMNSHAAY